MQNEYRTLKHKVIVYAKRQDGTVSQVLIDQADLDRMNEWSGSWCIGNTGGSTEYCYHSENGVTTYLHRWLLSPPGDRVVDHLNGNGLDCRRSNMQIVSHGENIRRGMSRRAIKTLKGRVDQLQRLVDQFKNLLQTTSESAQ